MNTINTSPNYHPIVRKRRPRLRGALHKYEPLDLTAFIKTLHAGSQILKTKPKTCGAFGGCAKPERARRKVIKDANPVGSPVA